ncbi:MAG: biopolymer transporter ExbD [bacterium]
MSGGGQLKAEHSKRGAESGRKRKKRVGFFVDLTPMVDINFLLLTFFMFTTTLAEPQIMEMRVPPEMKAEIKVKQSLLFTIYVRNDNKIFYALGMGDPIPTTIDKIRPMAEKYNVAEGAKNELITALKIDKKANYGLVVNILDELNVSEAYITKEISKGKDADGNAMLRERRFTIADITADERIKLYGGAVPAPTGGGNK